MRVGSLISTTIVAAYLAGTTPAVAQGRGAAASTDDARTTRARELFSQGAALAKQGRWRDALTAFEQSETLRPHATTVYDLGYCERALGHDTRARKYFKQALADNAARGGKELTPALQGVTDQYLREVEKQIAVANVTVTPTGATLTADGRPLELEPSAGATPVLVAGTRDPGQGDVVPARTFTLRIDPGAHVFVVSADGRSRVVEERFSAGERRTLELSLPPAPPRQTRRIAGESSADTYHPPVGWTSQRTWALVLAGSGVAALGAGTFFGLRANSRWNDARSACPALTTCPDDRGSTLSAEASRDGNLATIAFVAGAAALGGAGVLWFTAPSISAARPTVGAAIAPDAARFVVRGAF